MGRSFWRYHVDAKCTCFGTVSYYCTEQAAYEMVYNPQHPFNSVQENLPKFMWVDMLGHEQMAITVSSGGFANVENASNFLSLLSKTRSEASADVFIAHLIYIHLHIPQAHRRKPNARIGEVSVKYVSGVIVTLQSCSAIGVTKVIIWIVLDCQRYRKATGFARFV